MTTKTPTLAYSHVKRIAREALAAGTTQAEIRARWGTEAGRIIRRMIETR